jgi:hypothetical protein
MAFVTKSGNLDIAAGNYRITGGHDVVGNVAYVGHDFIGLRVKTGTAIVRSLTTDESVNVIAGQERLFSVSGDNNKAPVAQLASLAVPDPIPVAPPVPQAPAGPGAATAPAPVAKKSITKMGWVAILATIAGAIAAIAVIATRPVVMSGSPIPPSS